LHGRWLTSPNAFASALKGKCFVGTDGEMQEVIFSWECQTKLKRIKQLYEKKKTPWF
jgi:hypothetical protein